MIADRRKFRRETPEQRRAALIDATLDLVAQDGVRGATVRAIARRGQVSQGLIRHYFSTKDELIAAAYEDHMDRMTELTLASVAELQGSASDRLAAFVSAALSPPVVDPRSVALWASFLNKIRHDASMKSIHERTYTKFRDRLQALIEVALHEQGRSATDLELLHLATACNAVIDGLWLEGGALPEAFEPEVLVGIGLRSVAAITGLRFDQETG